MTFSANYVIIIIENEKGEREMIIVKKTILEFDLSPDGIYDWVTARETIYNTTYCELLEELEEKFGYNYIEDMSHTSTSESIKFVLKRKSFKKQNEPFRQYVYEIL